MTESFGVDFPHIMGDVTPYTAFIRSETSGALLNTGGSTITETAGTNGFWTFSSTTDRTPCTDYNVRIHSGTAETSGTLVFHGTLFAASNIVDKPFSASRHVVRGTVGNAVAPTTTTLTPSALAPIGVATGQFVGRILVFDNTTITTALRGQAATITASTGAALAALTFDALTTAPVSGDTFSIM